MIKRLYNYWLLPEIPEEAKGYRFFFVVNGSALWACNDLYESQSAHLIIPGNGCLYTLREDGNAWTLAETYSGMAGTGFNYSYNNFDIWVSPDIPNSQGTIVFQTSDRGFVEYGWSDGGEGDDLSVLQFTAPQGFHIAGTWKCTVSGTDSAVASFEWYRNGELISTETGKTQTECRPTADNIGVFTYKCVITFENGKSVTAGNMTMVVEEYDPGEDPGGGGDPDPGGGGGGGDDETSLVTGIDLHVYPDTVVPGGHATIEVTVNGIGNYSQAFTARLSGHASAETELFSAGKSCNVWIGEAETAEYVLVTVASVQDPTVTATEMVYIDYSGTEDEGTTQEQLQRAFWKGFAAARAYFLGAKVSGSVNIAREVAEPTANAGKLRRSFWKGFVSALTAAAGHGAPAGVLISSDGYILQDCNGLYLIAAVATEPEESMCLYGTPSESGNIGLRSGGTVQYYKGAVLPSLPNWDKTVNPYAVVGQYYSTGNSTHWWFIAYPVKPVTVTANISFLSYKAIQNEEAAVCFRAGATEGDAEWVIEEDPISTTHTIPLNKLAWTNFDVYNTDNNLYMSATDPIPVGEIVDYVDDIPIYERKDA